MIIMEKRNESNPIPVAAKFSIYRNWRRGSLTVKTCSLILLLLVSNTAL